MASLRKRGKHWYYRFTDSDGGKHERRGCPDKRATEQMAAAAELEAAKIRGGLIDPKEVAFRDHAGRPVRAPRRMATGHVGQGMTAKHADLSRDRAGKLIAMVKGVALDDLCRPQGGRDGACIPSVDRHIRPSSIQRFNRRDDPSPLARLTDEGRSLKQPITSARQSAPS